MTKITVSTAGGVYDVIIGAGLLEHAGDTYRCLDGSSEGGTAAVITDDIVDGLYAPRLEASLKAAGYNTVKFVIPHGEASKNPEELFRIVNFLAENHLTGSDTVFALGGGVVGDITGFAASIYLRGIHFVQIPTTLLSAVDSSVGGKTAVDLPSGKNLAGAYYQPDLVICDYSVLDTLSDEIFADGMAEVIKYGAIYDKSLYPLLPDARTKNIEKVIAKCVSIKSEIVGQDEKDKGIRQLLNFGHTFGHAIEKCSGYKISHGKAVAAGMAVMTEAAIKMNLCSDDCLDDLLKMIHAFGLPDKTDFSVEELYEALLSDKKRKGGTITLVVPSEPGRCILKKVSVQEAKEFLAAGLSI